MGEVVSNYGEAGFSPYSRWWEGGGLQDVPNNDVAQSYPVPEDTASVRQLGKPGEEQQSWFGGLMDALFSNPNTRNQAANAVAEQEQQKSGMQQLAEYAQAMQALGQGVQSLNNGFRSFR